MNCILIILNHVTVSYDSYTNYRETVNNNFVKYNTNVFKFCPRKVLSKPLCANDSVTRHVNEEK